MPEPSLSAAQRVARPTVGVWPRRPRLELPGGIFHVTIRGVRKLPIFHEDADRRIFLWHVGNVVRSHRWTCLAFVLMTNHYHLLVRTRQPNLASGMQRLNSRYAQGFNGRHGFEGHVFERRYVSVHVETDEHLLQVGPLHRPEPGESRPRGRSRAVAVEQLPRRRSDSRGRRASSQRTGSSAHFAPNVAPRTRAAPRVRLCRARVAGVT